MRSSVKKQTAAFLREKYHFFCEKTLDIYRAFGYNNTCRQANGQDESKYADVAELADALDSGLVPLKECGFKSLHPHQSLELRFEAFLLVRWLWDDPNHQVWQAVFSVG